MAFTGQGALKLFHLQKKKPTKQQLKNNSKILSAFVDCAVYQRFTFFTSVALPL